MKAITLTQPWASLVAISVKRIETRSWGTNYRGPLAIHAAKGKPSDWSILEELLEADPRFHNALIGAGLKTVEEMKALPRGAIIATCDLLFVERMHHITDVFGWERPLPDGTLGRWPIEPERQFGGYEDGRFAWLLHNTQHLPEPIPARGSLGLWDWQAPAQDSRESFQDAVRDDPDMTPEQKAKWLDSPPQKVDDTK